MRVGKKMMAMVCSDDGDVVVRRDDHDHRGDVDGRAGRRGRVPVKQQRARSDVSR